LLQGLPSKIRWVIRNWHGKCVELLEENGIRVATVKEPRLHFKVVIIDDEILYIGSINPLSVVTVREIPSDYMIRFESEALVDEIVENAIGEKPMKNGLKAGYNTTLDTLLNPIPPSYQHVLVVYSTLLYTP